MTAKILEFKPKLIMKEIPKVSAYHADRVGVTDTIDDRMRRIRLSLEKINQLMADLKSTRKELT